MGLIYPDSYTLAQAAAVVRQMLPKGRIWETAGADALAEALAGWYRRASNRVVQLAMESFGSTASETILQWGREYGLLDDPCADWPSTLADQQAVVQAAERARGGQSAAYFVSLAAAFGVAVTIDEAPYSPFRCGRELCGDALNNEDAIFEWLVTGPSATDADVQDRIECLIDRHKPAHTIVRFSWSA